MNRQTDAFPMNEFIKYLRLRLDVRQSRPQTFLSRVFNLNQSTLARKFPATHQ